MVGPNRNAVAITRHEEIANALTRDILRGRYRVGERLPSERDLSARFAASRGAAREAVKKLEQMGIVVVQPGGARVLPVEEASLDVLGHILRLDEVPDPDMVAQVMEVMEALITVAVQRTIANASDEEVAQARTMIARVLDPGAPVEEVVQARMNLWRHFLRMSGNLVLALIGKSLRVQIMADESDRARDCLASLDVSEQNQCLRWLDEALQERDAEAAASALKRHGELNRQLILPALELARHQQFDAREAAVR
jgi:DNA-binding FadR family transcriptional regulator